LRAYIGFVSVLPPTLLSVNFGPSPPSWGRFFCQRNHGGRACSGLMRILVDKCVLDDDVAPNELVFHDL
jgi:hypothetical protein